MEISRPWAGTTIGDAGPYTAPNWWDVWQSISKGSGSITNTGNVGVFYGVPGQLEVTYVGPNFLSVAAGAALIDGLFYRNDAAISVTVSSATVGNVRDDYLVIRKYFSTTTQIARLVLLAGSEVASPGPGTPPALTKDTNRLTYWDLPLARVSITDGGVITLTDMREYSDVIMKQKFYPFWVGYNETDGNFEYARADLYEPGVPAEDGDLVSAILGMSIPSDVMLSPGGNPIVLTMSALVVPLTASGNAYVKLEVYFGAIGYSWTTGSHNIGGLYEVAAVTADALCKILVHDFSGIIFDPDDQVTIVLARKATDALDTVGNTVYLRGILLDYLAAR